MIDYLLAQTFFMMISYGSFLVR